MKNPLINFLLKFKKNKEQRRKMLFKPINTQELLEKTNYQNSNNINVDIGPLIITDYESEKIKKIDRCNNIIIICPDSAEENNKIIRKNEQIIFSNNCDINLSTLINTITPNMGAVKLLFKFKLSIPSKFNFELKKIYPFISNIFVKYSKKDYSALQEYSIYSDFEIIIYIDFLLLRQYKKAFKISKNTDLMYLHVFPNFPINQSIHHIYTFSNSVLYYSNG